LIEITQQIAQ